MLARCEYCGSVLPDDATKCFACGNKHQSFVPPPIPPETLDEIQRMREKAQRKEKILGKVMPCFILASIISAIVSFIVMSNVGTIESIEICGNVAIGSCCAFILCIVLWFAVVISDAVIIRSKREELQATQKPPKPNKSECEQKLSELIQEMKAELGITG